VQKTKRLMRLRVKAYIKKTEWHFYPFSLLLMLS
jgi:hypothetical protein